MKTTQTTENQHLTRINFFEGSYCYSSESTDLRVTENYLQYKLAKQFEYRPTVETLWCSVETKSTVKHYVLDYENNVLELRISKQK